MRTEKIRLSNGIRPFAEIDVQGVYVKLAALAQQVEKLPLFNAPSNSKIEQQAAEQTAQEQTGEAASEEPQPGGQQGDDVIDADYEVKDD